MCKSRTVQFRPYVLEMLSRVHFVVRLAPFWYFSRNFFYLPCGVMHFMVPNQHHWSIEDWHKILWYNGKLGVTQKYCTNASIRYAYNMHEYDLDVCLCMCLHTWQYYMYLPSTPGRVSHWSLPVSLYFLCILIGLTSPILAVNRRPQSSQGQGLVCDDLALGTDWLVELFHGLCFSMVVATHTASKCCTPMMQAFRVSCCLTGFCFRSCSRLVGIS